MWKNLWKEDLKSAFLAAFNGLNNRLCKLGKPLKAKRL
jgi:hypothetical protein